MACDCSSKGFCSTGNMYCCGLKLHLPAFRRSVSFSDKIYIGRSYFQPRQQWIQLNLFTPLKKVKGLPRCIRQRDFAANNLFSTAVSKVRQPIEAFFNWLIEKSNIQNASKVRSSNGLWLHCFGKLAIACLTFIFNP